jgi:hypothetical protein
MIIYFQNWLHVAKWHLDTNWSANHPTDHKNIHDISAIISSACHFKDRLQ